MAIIFLSYKTEDESTALVLKRKLRALGHELKTEEDKGYAEGDWRKNLMHSLKQSDGLVALLTENGLRSQFISSEIGMARAFKDAYKDMFIIPALVGAHPIPNFIQDLRTIVISSVSEDEITKLAHEIHRAITQFKNANRYPKIFISHRHKDQGIAKALVGLLEAVFEVDTKDIRCTSVSPYTLSLGEKTSERLRKELAQAEVVLGLIGKDTKESNYVLSELGAAWGRDTPTFPLLVSGATIQDVPSPLNERNCISLEERGRCWELVDELKRRTSLTQRDSKARMNEVIEELTRSSARELIG